MTAVLLAKWLGLFMSIFGLALLIHRDHYKRAASEVASNAGLHIPAALIPLIIGSFVVLTHNVWVANWQVLVTITGWYFLIMGAFRSLLVTIWCDCMQKHHDSVSLVLSLFTFVMGILMLYFGFSS